MSLQMLTHQIPRHIRKVGVSHSGLILSSPLSRSLHASASRRVQYFDANQETFQKVVSKENSKGRVVLVDFYAEWCGPCKMLSPILEKLTSTENGTAIKSGSGLDLDLVTIDTDVEQKLALEYKVSSLPTVIAFKDGEPVRTFIGAIPEPRVKQFIGDL